MLTNEQKQKMCAECGGKCCKYDLSKPIFPHNKYQIEYWDARRAEYIEIDGYRVYLHKTQCPQLDPETNKCRIYEKRPQLCRDFPFMVSGMGWEVACPILAYYKKKPEERDESSLRGHIKYRL